MTKREKFATIKGILNEQGIVEWDEFLDHEVELLSRKRSKSSKPTKRQVENEGVKARIAEVLTDEGQTVTEILKALGDDTLTNQRVSALLRQMTEAGDATKDVVKGKALWTAQSGGSGENHSLYHFTLVKHPVVTIIV